MAERQQGLETNKQTLHYEFVTLKEAFEAV